MSKKVNPIALRLAITKSWNLESRNNKIITPKDIILRKVIFLFVNFYKIKIISYKLINNHNTYILYINNLPIKQKLVSYKNKSYWFKLVFHNLLKLNKFKFLLEKHILKIMCVSTRIYFKNTSKSLLVKKKKPVKKWFKKFFKPNNKLLLYFFKYSLAYSSTLFLGFFIQQMLRKYKRQRKMLWKTVIETIKDAFKSNKNLLGIRLKVKGKLNGRKRTKVLLWSLGSVPIQSTKALIKYSINYCYNIYGSFGVKLWLHLI